MAKHESQTPTCFAETDLTGNGARISYASDEDLSF